MRRPLASLVLLASLLGFSNPALANHTRILTEDFGLETAFLTQLVEEREEICFADSIDPADPIAVHGCTVRLKVWREDLNKDGAYELFVLVEQADLCGSAGCDLNLYERRFGEWTLMTNGSAFGRPEVFDDPANDWPILVFFGFSGRIWKKTERGGEYVWFCVSDLCRFFHGGDNR